MFSTSVRSEDNVKSGLEPLMDRVRVLGLHRCNLSSLLIQAGSIFLFKITSFWPRTRENFSVRSARREHMQIRELYARTLIPPTLFSR